MLTREHAVTRYDFQTMQALPDRLTVREHAQYADYANRMIAIYREGTGRRRRELHRDVHQVFAEETECPLRRIEAFCKLLDDASTYADSGRRDASGLRRSVFRRAAKFHPLVEHPDSLFEHELNAVRRQIASDLNDDWTRIEDELFADVIDFHRLESFSGYSEGRALLSRYNVAQVQVAMYSALSMNVYVQSDFKMILRAARLATLMHTITRTGDAEYHIRFDGPASVLRETRRYGVRMAKFLPSLISCSNWKMQAIIQTRSGWKLGLNLTSQDGLRSHRMAEDAFDSSIEADFAAKWGDGEVHQGWSLEREAEILHSGQRTFVPDFLFRHQSGSVVLMEIVGFWTPEYISHRLESLVVFRNTPILLAIHESTVHRFTPVISSHARVITYKSVLRVSSVLEALAGSFSP